MYKLTVYKIGQRIEIANGNQYKRRRTYTIQVVVVKWLTAWPSEALTWVRVPVRNGLVSADATTTYSVGRFPNWTLIRTDHTRKKMMRLAPPMDERRWHWLATLATEVIYMGECNEGLEHVFLVLDLAGSYTGKQRNLEVQTGQTFTVSAAFYLSSFRFNVRVT